MLSDGEVNYTAQLGFRKGKTTQRVPRKHKQHTDKLFRGTRNQPGPSITSSQPVCNAGTKLEARRREARGQIQIPELKAS